LLEAKEEKRILLVEDDKGDALLVRKVLRKKKPKWNVHVTVDAQKAIEWLSKNEPPDLIISDYMLPVGSGLDVVRTAREIGAYGIPVIMLTGTGDESLAVQALKAGAIDYLTKDTNETKNLPRIIERVFREWANIEERKKTEEQLKYRSAHDTLTDLYNRAYFMDKLKVYDAAKSYPLSIVVGDIDNFKAINDNFGHPTGDEILKYFAYILKKHARSDDIVARMGGDEFAVIVPKADEKVVIAFCNAIQRDCKQFDATNLPGERTQIRDTPGRVELKLRVSLGFATQQGQFGLIEHAMREADRRMYDAKSMKKRFGEREIAVQVLQSVMRERLPQVLEHSERMLELTSSIGVRLNLSDSAVEDLTITALFHDIGKMGIPDDILWKEEALTEGEMERLKQHTIIGYELLRSIPVLSHIAEYVLYHHERWDGNGYPDGLKGAEIPLFSRIIFIADAYDAMINDRPYKRAMWKNDAIEELKKGAGSQFDPELVVLYLNELQSEGDRRKV
jgi:diguanylate cyclase (GGDEF)-like protein